MTREQLGPLTADFVVAEATVVVDVTPASLVGQDPTRWALIIAAKDPTRPLTVGTNGSLAVGQGITLNAQNPCLNLNFREVGALVTVPWWAISSTGNNGVEVFTVQYRPQGGD